MYISVHHDRELEITTVSTHNTAEKAVEHYMKLDTLLGRPVGGNGFDPENDFLSLSTLSSQPENWEGKVLLIKGGIVQPWRPQGVNP